MSAIQRSNAVAKKDGVWFITIDDWMLAKSCVGPSITRGVTVEIPKVSWDDIGGLNDLKVSSCLFLLFLEDESLFDVCMVCDFGYIF